jgi:magnesium-transporting ATPase (P-type)
MRDNDYESNDELSHIEKKREKTKEKILDETFKKAELQKGKPQNNKEEKKTKKPVERPFLKSCILLIIVAIIALTFINYSPWMYINHQTNEGPVEQFVYRDIDNDVEFNQTLLGLFYSPCTNCSNNSQNYIGLTFDDFTESPQTISNGIFALIIIGIIFTVFLVIDKFRRFSEEIIYATHSLFSIGAIITSMIILISTIKFIGTYFLLYHNQPFIEMSGINNINIIFLTPIIIVILSFIIIRGSIMTFKINYREMEKKFILNPERPYSTYRYGSKFK